jgi:hypothetical protein
LSEKDQEDHDSKDREQDSSSDDSLSLSRATLSFERRQTGATTLLESLKLPFVSRGSSSAVRLTSVAVASTIFRHDRER